MHDFRGHPQGTTCKIVQVGAAVAGVAGLLGDPEAKWQTSDFARAALRSEGDRGEKLDNFVARTRAVVEPLLRRIRLQDSELYRQNVLNKPFIQAVFADRAGFHQVTLEPVSDGIADVRLKVHRQSCDSSCDQTYVALGHFDYLGRVVDATPNFWQRDRIPEQIRDLIAVEEKADPGRVGGPISVVRVDKAGVTWLTKGVCG